MLFDVIDLIDPISCCLIVPWRLAQCAHDLTRYQYLILKHLNVIGFIFDFSGLTCQDGSKACGDHAHRARGNGGNVEQGGPRGRDRWYAHVHAWARGGGGISYECGAAAFGLNRKSLPVAEKVGKRLAASLSRAWCSGSGGGDGGGDSGGSGGSGRDGGGGSASRLVLRARSQATGVSDEEDVSISSA